MKALMGMEIKIDGALGEGGGQVLRSALSLSLLTGQGFEIKNIRAGRKKPGLMRQHLTAVKAAASISNSEVDGDEIGSTELRFIPGKVDGGEFHFSIGSAGSTMLILQTILLPLAFSDEQSIIELEGGTHNPFAPNYHFMSHTYLPILHSMGFDVSVALEKPGYYPAGGGRVRVSVNSSRPGNEIDLISRGALLSRKAIAVANNIANDIARRELKVVQSKLGLEPDELLLNPLDKGDGPGNMVLIELEYENMTEVFAEYGQVGKPAEGIASKISQQALRYMSSTAPVGDYLADQLLLPLALSKSGRFKCTSVSSHFKTNIETIKKFMPFPVKIEREDRLAWNINL